MSHSDRLVGWLRKVNALFSVFFRCVATFCHVNTIDYPQLVPVGDKYVKDGDSLVLKCVRLPQWWTESYAVGWCSDTTITFAGCKYLINILTYRTH